MRRALVYFVQVAVLAAAAVWLADHPGRVEIDWLGYRVETYFGVLLALLLVAALLFDGARRAWRLLAGAPGDFVARRQARRREDGFRALTHGMAAVAAGDRDEARRLARRADTLLRDPGVTGLLSAQAAALDGDEAAARRYFDALAADRETAFLGLTGLMRQAIREGDDARTLELAERARRLRPDSAFVSETLFDLQTRGGRWREAQATLFDAVRRGLRPEEGALGDRAAILAARAGAALRAERFEEAADFAGQALASVEDFVPAAALRARALAGTGKPRRAARHLEEAWSRRPHPELAAAYLALRPGEEPLQRAKRVQQLAAGNPGAPESRRALAAAALEAGLWGEARRNLAELGPADEFDAGTCRLMARLEREENGDGAAAGEWLERAARAPAGKGWTCGTCGAAAPEWSALCGNCGAFGTVSWKRPPRVAVLPAAPAGPGALEAPAAKDGEGGVGGDGAAAPAGGARA